MQKTTALSTAEAEYYSASTAAMEVLYLQYLLERLDFAQQKPTPVYEDNLACIEWGNNVIGGRERAKHIDIRKHFAHEVIQNGEMLLIKVPTLAQLADILTKGLHLQQSTLCVWNGSWDAGGPELLRGPLSSRGGRSPRLSSRVTSALKRGVLQTWGAQARARHRLESESSGRPAAGGESVG